jgi:3-oxoacyl-[acyl-carrier protein] reductase
VQIDSEVVDRMPAGRSAYVTAKSAQIGLTRRLVVDGGRGLAV